MLNQNQINSYKENGFLVVHNLLSKEEIENFFIAQGGGESEEYKKYGLRRHVVDDSWSYLANHSKVVCIVSELLEGNPRIVQTLYRDKQPGGTGVAPHQDTHYIKNEPNTLMACWLALTNTDSDNGGLCVVPGSHKRHLYDTQPPSDEKEHEHSKWVEDYRMSDKEGNEWIEKMHAHQVVDLDPKEIIYLSVPIGSGVFFTSMTIHGSFANKSINRPRLAIATHYIKEGTWIYRKDIQETTKVK